MEVAAARGVRGLVLGACDCGVFQNDPAEVAGAFRRPLTAPGARFGSTFDTVVFAVLDRSKATTRAAFEAAFAPERPRPGRSEGLSRRLLGATSSRTARAAAAPPG